MIKALFLVIGLFVSGCAATGPKFSHQGKEVPFNVTQIQINSAKAAKDFFVELKKKAVSLICPPKNGQTKRCFKI